MEVSEFGGHPVFLQPQMKSMKKVVIASLFFVIAGTVLAQKGTTAVKATTPKPPVAKGPVLKTLEDSANYAIGVSVANFYKQQGISKLNTALITRAITEIMSGKKTLMNDDAANACMNTFMSKLQENKSKPNIKEGQDFLAKNKLKAGVKTTASGLQYEVITEGTGEKPAAVTDSVTCHYAGTLINGTEFDNSYKRGQPITFALNKVIPGWTEGLQLMSVGSKYKLYVPYTLGYGEYDYGPIPGGSTLVFEVELLAVKKPVPNQ